MFTFEGSTRRVMVLAGLALFVVTAVTRAQVPTKPPPKDTVAKQQGTSRAANPAPKKIIIRKEQTSAGEVALPRIVAPSIPRCEEIAPVCGLDPMHDAAIRAEQYQLDSIVTALQRARLMNEMQIRIDATRDETRRQTEDAMRAQRELEANAIRLRMASRGWYAGVAGGTSAPQRYVRDGYTGGFNVTVPIGFDATDLPLGIRVDASTDHMNGTRVRDQFGATTAASGDITVWSLNADLKARMTAPGTTRTHVYALAGLGAHRVTGGVYGTNGSTAGNNLSFSRAGAKLGWNVGAGAAFSWGPAELFVESRFMQVKTDYAYRLDGGLGRYTSFSPLVVGLQWF